MDWMTRYTRDPRLFIVKFRRTAHLIRSSEAGPTVEFVGMPINWAATQPAYARQEQAKLFAV